MKTVIEMINQSIEQQENVVSNTDYIEWLYEFTKAHPRFTDNDWLYAKDSSMSDADYAQVDLLTDFYTAVDKYHRRNCLKSNGTYYSVWYNIKYKDAYFAIGLCVAQGAYNFVTRYESYEEMLPEHYIAFDYIMHNKPAHGIEEKRAKLQELQEIMLELKDMEVPSREVRDIYNKVFTKSK